MKKIVNLVLVIALVGLWSSCGGGIESDMQKMADYQCEMAGVKKQMAEEARRRQALAAEALRAELATNKDAIIREAETLMRDRSFSEAYKRVQKYAALKDPKLIEIAARATSKMNKAKEKEVLSILSKIPASNYVANIKHYLTLTKMFPENNLYKQKLTHYRELLYARREATKNERKNRVTRFGEPPEPRPFDGTYTPVRRYTVAAA